MTLKTRWVFYTTNLSIMLLIDEELSFASFPLRTVQFVFAYDGTARNDQIGCPNVCVCVWWLCRCSSWICKNVTLSAYGLETSDGDAWKTANNNRLRFGSGEEEEPTAERAVRNDDHWELLRREEKKKIPVVCSGRRTKSKPACEGWRSSTLRGKSDVRDLPSTPGLLRSLNQSSPWTKQFLHKLIDCIINLFK